MPRADMESAPTLTGFAAGNASLCEGGGPKGRRERNLPISEALGKDKTLSPTRLRGSPLPEGANVDCGKNYKYFTNVGINLFISIGFAIWSFMPASSARWRSSAKALAVMAMMGISALAASSRRRILRVAV